MITTPTISLPYPHRLQREVLLDRSRFRILVCGRRWGKTTTALIASVEAVVRGQRGWWVLPNYPMSSEAWRMLKITLRPVTAAKREDERYIEAATGGSITIKSADNPDGLRGVGLDFVIVDEAAFIAEEVWTAALRPTLSDRDREGWALLIGTPKGRNWFYHQYHRGQDPLALDARSWQHPTSSSPSVKPEEIEAARSELPEDIFRQEYEAVFLEGTGIVFRNLEACLHAPESTPEAHLNHELMMGVDWGKHQDFTALSVGCATCQAEVALDRFNQIDYEFQRARLRALADHWRVRLILAEQNAMGEPIIEAMQREGLPVQGFVTTAATKPPLIENLALSFERAEWQWLPEPVGRGELEAYERTMSPVTGRSAYSAPPGKHDDTVMARALMLRAAQTPSVRFRWL